MSRGLVALLSFGALAGCRHDAPPPSAPVPLPAEAAAAACGSGDEVSCRAHATEQCGAATCADGLLDRWCTEGDATSCYTLGYDADHSRPLQTAQPVPGMTESSYTETPKDPVAARRYDERACQLGSLGGCVNLGALLAHGHGGDVDWGRAEQLFQRACDGGMLRGCASLASVYFEGGPPAKRDEARSATISAKACDAGDDVACANLAFQYAEGRGVEHDLAKGRALFDRACHAGNGPACVSAAALSSQGSGVPVDETRMTEYMLAGCAAPLSPSEFACGAAGRRVAEGIGIAADAPRGLGLLEHACSDGYAIGCAQLGLYYAQGKVVAAADPARARTYYARACELGHAPSCALK